MPRKDARPALTDKRWRRHHQLVNVCKYLPTDYAPYGQRSNDERGGDCSTGCRFYHELKGESSYDWGVCFNPKSPRAGLLTFEHQGCLAFTRGRDA